MDRPADEPRSIAARADAGVETALHRDNETGRRESMRDYTVRFIRSSAWHARRAPVRDESLTGEGRRLRVERDGSSE